MLVTRAQFDYLGDCVAALDVVTVDCVFNLNCRKNRNQ